METFKAYKERGAITFGEMWVRALNGYISTRMDCGDHKTVEAWQSFGDPTLAIADESLPPEKPSPPEGSSSGSTNTEYTYTASTTDPDNDKLYYNFSWGDGTYSDWVGPYNSGDICDQSHTWTKSSIYGIRVKAKDEHGLEGDWSEPTYIFMPRERTFSYNTILMRIIEIIKIIIK